MDANKGESKEFDGVIAALLEHTDNLKMRLFEVDAGGAGPLLERTIKIFIEHFEVTLSAIAQAPRGDLHAEDHEYLQYLNVNIPAYLQFCTVEHEDKILGMQDRADKHFEMVKARLKSLLADKRSIQVFLESPVLAATAWGMFAADFEFDSEECLFKRRQAIYDAGKVTASYIAVCREVEFLMK